MKQEWGLIFVLFVLFFFVSTLLWGLYSHNKLCNEEGFSFMDNFFGEDPIWSYQYVGEDKFNCYRYEIKLKDGLWIQEKVYKGDQE